MPPTTPSLHDKVRARMKINGAKCSVCLFLASLPKATRDEWNDVLREPKANLPDSAIAAEMTEQAQARDQYAKAYGRDTIARHRTHMGDRP